MGAQAAANTTDGASPKRAAIRSHVHWAVLSLLIERPGHGYLLKQRVEEEYEGLLAARGGHVYKSLEALEDRGLIEEVSSSRMVRPANRRDRRQRTMAVTYRPTQEGVSAFKEWLLAQMSEDRRQSWVFLRLLATFAHEPEMGLQVIERLEQGYAEEAREVPINPPYDSYGGVASRLATILIAEERRLAPEAKLPLARFVRRVFEDLAENAKTQRELR